jgi:hypothetical protein
MLKGKGGMGMHKHGVSGVNPKSPKQRLFERMMAEKDKNQDEAYIKKNPIYSSIGELLKAEKER